MREQQRHRLILHVVNERGFVRVVELVDILQASEATVRRDLRRLDAGGRIRRVRGGAEALDLVSRSSLAGHASYSMEHGRHAAAKRAVGRCAAQLCRTGQSIIIEGGTTTAMMAEFLPDDSLQVLTNSIPVMEYLLTHTRNKVLVPGGELVREQRVILSHPEDTVIATYHASTLFMSPQGIGAHGLLQSDMYLVQLERRLIRHADQIVVLADASKLEGRGNVVVCGWDQVHLVITDSRTSSEQMELLEAAGIEVVVAEDLDASSAA